MEMPICVITRLDTSRQNGWTREGVAAIASILHTLVTHLSTFLASKIRHVVEDDEEHKLPLLSTKTVRKAAASGITYAITESICLK